MDVFNKIIFEIKEFRRTILEILGKTVGLPFRMYNYTKLKKKNFTIISNNCWGGGIYQKLNMPYLSPTVGLYFYADDYIRFLKNLDYYLSLNLVMIKKENSKYFEKLKHLNVYREYPIGVLDDIEIIFLHYRNEGEAMEKWERRKKRINKNRLIIKFNDQNDCKLEHLIEFEKLPYSNKICYVAKNYPECANLIVAKQRNSHCIKNDMNFFKKPINIIDYINNIK